jgi:deoxyribonuclease V
VAEWPTTVEALVAAQEALAEETPPPWRPTSEEPAVGACFVCFERGPSGPGRKGEPGWAGAAIVQRRHLLTTATVRGKAGAAYEPGLLALREGPLLEAAVRGLPGRPDALLVDATGRDHPRGAGLALHLGAVLDLPTVGVTHRPLLAAGEWPRDERGATSPLTLGDTVVGCWLRTRRGTRPLAVHAGWRPIRRPPCASSRRRCVQPARPNRFALRAEWHATRGPDGTANFDLADVCAVNCLS